MASNPENVQPEQRASNRESELLMHLEQAYERIGYLEQQYQMLVEEVETSHNKTKDPSVLEEQQHINSQKQAALEEHISTL